ncbi:MAG: SH3 domain-containing protein [Anaerolineae bacterium]|nr:SH3 domain-containing protein [Anaerolineae bacterium]
MRVRNAAVNVREGPDPNYRVLVVLNSGETLPLVGRHHGFRWWAVSLPDGATGWVWESGVNVFGDIASVPLLPAPPLNGVVPDTTEEWTPVITTPCLDPDSSGEDEGGEGPPVVLPEPDEANALVRDGWSQPLNLSQSGGVGNPILIADETESLHALWEDNYDGYVYARLEGDAWATAVTITVPFSDTQPHLFASPNSQLQALWIDEEGALQHSRIDIATITDEAGWQQPVELADSGTAMAATVDGEGVLHLAYLRAGETAGNPAGVYYRRSEDGGANWSPAELLYASSYLRGSSAGESNVQIAATTAAGETNVYVAWDNRPRKRLFLIHGRDGGAEWHSPVELAGPDSTSSIILPFNVRLSANGNNVLVVWQYGQPGNQCQRRAQASTDAGQNWSPPVTLTDPNPGFASCASEQQLYAGDSLFFLLTAIDNQLFLEAWNGTEWSEPQRQTTISAFNDPETLNTVILGCHEAAVLDGPLMVLLGCDASGAFVTGDIWFTLRSLGTAATWFPPPTEWGTPIAVAGGAPDAGSFTLLDDASGTVHALWLTRNAEQEANALYYSRQDGERWLSAVNLSSGFGAANLPAGPLATAISPDDRLFAVWLNSAGVLVLSQADAGSAAFSSGWAPPAVLPVTATTLSGVDLAVEADGTLAVAYSVPVNEGRGVYLLRSEDQGASWSEPVAVLDAAAMAWEFAGGPQLRVSAAGSLHILVPEQKLQLSAAVSAVALHYIRCAPGGATCSEPIFVAETQPHWSAVVTTGAQTVHHLLQEQTDGDLLMWHRFSNDDGRTWSELQLVARTAAAGAGPVDVVADSAGRLHLFQSDAGTLIPWLWENGVWRQEGLVTAAIEGALQGIVTRQGTVAVLFSREGERKDETEAGPEMELVSIRRQLELDAPLPAPTPLPETLPEVTPTASLTAAPSPTPTASTIPLPEIGDNGNVGGAQASANTPVAQIGAGLIPVTLLVVVVMALGARSVWLRRR